MAATITVAASYTTTGGTTWVRVPSGARGSASSSPAVEMVHAADLPNAAREPPGLPSAIHLIFACLPCGSVALGTAPTAECPLSP